MSEVIDVGLGRYRGLYATQRVGSRVNSHFAVEGGVKCVLCAEMHDIMLLIIRLYAIGKEIIVIGVARSCQWTEQRSREYIDVVIIEIAGGLQLVEQDMIVGQRE